MPRKPNYKFERYERDRLKAEKKAARLQAKAEKRNQKQAGDDQDDDGADTVEVETADTITDTRETD